MNSGKHATFKTFEGIQKILENKAFEKFGDAGASGTSTKLKKMGTRNLLGEQQIRDVEKGQEKQVIRNNRGYPDIQEKQDIQKNPGEQEIPKIHEIQDKRDIRKFRGASQCKKRGQSEFGVTRKS